IRHEHFGAHFSQKRAGRGRDRPVAGRSDRRTASLVARSPPKSAAAADVEGMLLTQRCQQPRRRLGGHCTHLPNGSYQKDLNMRNTLKTAALVLALAAPTSPAEELTPDALVRTISLEVLATIRQDKDIQCGNPNKIASLVAAKLMPHFDLVNKKLN